MMIYFTRSRLGGTYIYIHEYLLSVLDCGRVLFFL